MLELLRKIKRRGITWFIARIIDKTYHRSSFLFILLSPLISLFYYFIIIPINKLFSFFIENHFDNDKKLYLFYDLDVCPVTFDFSWALLIAEHERVKRQLKGIRVIFVPGKTQGLREEEESYRLKLDIFFRYWRQHHILYSLCGLLPTCVGFTFCATREEAALICEQVMPNIYPQRYSVMFPMTHALARFLKYTKDVKLPLEATLQACRYIRQWLFSRLRQRKLITITLRCSAYMSIRNSNIIAWTEFAKKLNPDEYFVVFIPDTDMSLEELPDELKSFTCFSEPCWNLDLRAALYEMSYLNLGVNNGVMALCWLNKKCHYITFKIMVNGAPQTSKKAMMAHGFRIGKSLSFATPFQKWVWEDDDEEIITREFNLMCAKIEGKELVLKEKI